MTLLAYVVGSLALAIGTGIVILALLKMERREDRGRVGKGWMHREGRREWSR